MLASGLPIALGGLLRTPGRSWKTGCPGGSPGFPRCSRSSFVVKSGFPLHDGRAAAGGDSYRYNNSRVPPGSPECALGFAPEFASEVAAEFASEFVPEFASEIAPAFAVEFALEFAIEFAFEFAFGFPLGFVSEFLLNSYSYR